jgi:hypothetical protein
MSTSSYLSRMEDKITRRDYTHDDVMLLVSHAIVQHSVIGDLKLQIEHLKAPDPFRRKH